MSATRSGARSGIGSWVLIGAMMGILAGVVFIFFEMAAAAEMGKEAAGPLRMISAIVLGKNALPPSPTVSTASAVFAGFVIHFGLAAIFGAVFGAIVGSLGILRTNRWALIIAGGLAGIFLWGFNFYVISPIVFPWFQMSDPFLQFIAHTFFYGGMLGLLLEGARPKGDEG